MLLVLLIVTSVILNAQLVGSIPIPHTVTSIAVGSKTIVAGTDNGCIYIIKSMNVIRSFCPLSRINDVAAYGEIFVAVGSGQLIIFNENGILKRIRIGGLYDSAVATNGEIVVACKWKCLALTLDGKTLWTFRVKWVRNGVTFVGNNIVIADALGRTIDLLNSKGRLLKIVNVDEEPWDVTSCKDKVFASLTTSVIAFDKSLKTLWNLGGFISLLKIASNNNCFAATIDSSAKEVVVMDPSGKIVTKIPVNAMSIAWKDNYLYVGTSRGIKVYKFQLSTPNLLVKKPEIVKSHNEGIYQKLEKIPVVGDTLSKLFLKKALSSDYFSLEYLVNVCYNTLSDVNKLVKEIKGDLDKGDLYGAAEAIGKAKLEISFIKERYLKVEEEVKKLARGDEIIKICGGRNVIEALENCSKSLEKILKLREELGGWDKVADAIVGQEARVMLKQLSSCVSQLDVEYNKVINYQNILLALLG